MKNKLPESIPLISFHSEASIARGVLATLTQIAHAELPWLPFPSFGNEEVDDSTQAIRKVPVVMPVSAAMAVCALHLQLRYGEKKKKLIRSYQTQPNKDYASLKSIRPHGKDATLETSPRFRGIPHVKSVRKNNCGGNKERTLRSDVLRITKVTWGWTCKDLEMQRPEPHGAQRGLTSLVKELREKIWVLWEEQIVHVNQTLKQSAILYLTIGTLTSIHFKFIGSLTRTRLLTANLRQPHFAPSSFSTASYSSFFKIRAMASESYALGPYKIDPTEVFYSTQLSYAIVNLRPVVPGIKKGDVEAADQEEGIEVAWNQVKLGKLSDDSGDLRGVYSEVKLLKRSLLLCIFAATIFAATIWVAANYALGTLGGTPRETTGIVELGGASMQLHSFIKDYWSVDHVVFALKDPQPKQFSRNLKFAGVTYNLRAQSLPHYGQDAVWQTLQEKQNSRDVTRC
ncbi:hypothetical protein QQ045_030411 [Rhodiola kirilowii]